MTQEGSHPGAPNPRPHGASRIHRACQACGRITTTRHCPACTPTIRSHNDPAYKRARARLLTHATHCWICGGAPTLTDPLTADHITPLAAGGTHHPTNLRAAHETCNKKRGSRMRKTGAVDSISSDRPPTTDSPHLSASARRSL